MIAIRQLQKKKYAGSCAQIISFFIIFHKKYKNEKSIHFITRYFYQFSTIFSKYIFEF